MKFKRFTKPEFLKTVGRNSLALLFGKFAPTLAAKNVELPKTDLPDEEYFKSLARLALAPDTLPDDCIEALFCIEEMANDEGLERVRRSARQLDLDLKLPDDCSVGDAIAQAFIIKPELVAQQHNEVRLLRLSSFEYHGAKNAVDCSATFVPPEQAVIALLAGDLDEWFRNNNRGRGNVQIEIYPIDGEYWYLVRHGDMFARMPKLQDGKVEVIHYRPAKDDVVVYCPMRDELRIHADTKGERELYRTAFGHRLRGDAQHFSQRKAYSLEPLRDSGSDSLDVTNVTGLDRVVLRELEVAYDNEYADVVIRRSDDLFASAKERDMDAVPKSGRLVRAKFDFYFRGVKKPRPVQLRPPNILKLGRRCDAAIVQQWLSANGFRAVNKADDGLFTMPRNIVPLMPAGTASKPIPPITPGNDEAVVVS